MAWYKKLGMYMVQISLCNAYIVYLSTTPELQLTFLDLQHFVRLHKEYQRLKEPKLWQGLVNGILFEHCHMCELHVHVDCSPFSCSDCRQCHHDGHQDHAHATCYIILLPECKFGRLKKMILPPNCVRVTAQNFSKMLCFRISESSQKEPGKQTLKIFDGNDAVKRNQFRTISVPRIVKNEQVVKLSILAGQEAALRIYYIPNEPQDYELQQVGKQTLKIFDGNDAVKRNQFRTISVPRIVKNEQVVKLSILAGQEAALRIYYIPNEPQDYELQVYCQQVLVNEDITNCNGATENPKSQSVFKESVPEAWVLRAKPKESEVLNIYAGWLKLGVAYITILITKKSTVESVIKEVLQQLGKSDEDPEGLRIVEVHMGSTQVQRQVLTNQELLLEKLQDIRKNSIRQMNQTRFYIVENRNSVVQVNLLVSGLPVQLSEKEYTELLQEHLAIKIHLVSVSHVYTWQGAVVLEISCFSEAERIYMLAKDTIINGKQISAVIIPEIMHKKLPQECCPVLLFVNPKSGGLKGRDLLYSFRKLLNPHQVFELTSAGPLPGLHTFRQVPHFRILVCGGDGTVGWVLGVLEEIRHKLACSEPAIGIVPLGTGNDLARVLRWGAGYSGEDPHSVLMSFNEAEEVLMDRWTILLDAQEVVDEDKENGITEPEPPKIVHMNNYCGLGIDAELSLGFHHAREEEPGKFNSRFHNKGVYVKVGLQKISHTRNLHKHLQLQVDQHEVELPSIEGLIFLNIPSWGSGADLWGSDSDARYWKPGLDDGLLEVVGVTGVVHMGQVQGGLRSGIRIAQGAYVRVTITKPIPVQVDGEPWIQPPGEIIISAAGPKKY
ncbi:Diacylglycerol kinase theta [Acipenser ruthenus]|uniref:Diacylglycerol kinase n=1 Tax=Acipenser ruthenus TaxID=7906 RepID=A0A662YRS2_ACIRT|nr:Diacylglycerol kinase theta [Acipenser ruthenus]